MAEMLNFPFPLMSNASNEFQDALVEMVDIRAGGY